MSSKSSKSEVKATSADKISFETFQKTFASELAQAHKGAITYSKFEQDDPKRPPATPVTFKNLDLFAKKLAEKLDGLDIGFASKKKYLQNAILQGAAKDFVHTKNEDKAYFTITKQQSYDIWAKVRQHLKQKDKQKKITKSPATRVTNFLLGVFNIFLPPLASIRSYFKSRKIDATLMGSIAGADQKPIRTTPIVGWGLIITWVGGVGTVGLLAAIRLGLYQPMVDKLPHLATVASLEPWALFLVGLGVCMLARAVGTMIGQIHFRIANSEHLQNEYTKKKHSVTNMAIRSLKQGILGSTSKGLKNTMEDLAEGYNKVKDYLIDGATNLTGSFIPDVDKIYKEKQEVADYIALQNRPAVQAHIKRQSEIAQGSNLLDQKHSSHKVREPLSGIASPTVVREHSSFAEIDDQKSALNPSKTPAPSEDNGLGVDFPESKSKKSSTTPTVSKDTPEVTSAVMSGLTGSSSFTANSGRKTSLVGTEGVSNIKNGVLESEPKKEGDFTPVHPARGRGYHKKKHQSLTPPALLGR
ncbi:MAG: hypothetical protein QM752_05800 [Gammaproteobacteria bacterium]